MTAVLVAPPTSEPVSLAEARQHVRVDTDAEDALIGTLVTAARVHIEKLTGRALLTQGWRIYEDDWPTAGVVKLGPVPVASVDAVTVYAGDGTAEVVPTNRYAVDVVGAPGRLKLLGSAEAGQALNGIEIDLTCGYGPTGADVPAPIRQAILLLVAFWFEHREAAETGAVTPDISHGVASLCAPYRRVRL